MGIDNNCATMLVFAMFALQLGFLVPSPAQAGTGSIVAGGPSPDNCDDPRTTDTTETCSDGEHPGDVSLAFAFMYPPTQADIDQAHHAMLGASRILFDATDSQIRIAKVKWIMGDAAAETADIRYYSTGFASTRSHAHLRGLGVPGLSVTIYGSADLTGDVVAHELGHYLFGLQESYAEDADNTGNGFDGVGEYNGWTWSRYMGWNGSGSLTSAIGAFSPNNPDQNNSVMQLSQRSFCVNSEGLSLIDSSPVYPGENPVACGAAVHEALDEDADDGTSPVFVDLDGNGQVDAVGRDPSCAFPRSFCPLTGQYNSELSTASNFDPLIGLGSTFDVLPTREYVISGNVPSSYGGPTLIDLLAVHTVDTEGSLSPEGIRTALWQGDETTTWFLDLYYGGEIFATYQFDFDAEGTLKFVNGITPIDIEGGADDNPVIVLGSDGPVAGVDTTYGVLPETGELGGQKAYTGSFGAGPQVLTIRFDNLRQQQTYAASGHILRPDNALLVHGRFGQVETGAYAGREILDSVGCTQGEELCELGWNDETQRFETSKQGRQELVRAWVDSGKTSVEEWKAFVADVAANRDAYLRGEWQWLRDYLADAHGVTVDAPVRAVPAFDVANYVAPVFEPSEPTANFPQQLILALDKSGSMAQPLDPFSDYTRLDYAKESGRAFLTETLRAIPSPEIGLFWYDAPDVAGELYDGITAVADAQLRRLTSGSILPNPDELTDSEVLEQLTEDTSGTIGFADLRRFMRDQPSYPDSEYPTPNGMTAIGEALQFARERFPSGSTNTQAVVLLSDGEETAFPGGLTDVDPTEQARELRDRGIRIYSLALGANSDPLFAAELAAMTGGLSWGVRDVRELPATFFEVAVRLGGEDLASNVRTPVAVREIGGDEFSSYLISKTVAVEQNATRLTFMLSQNRLNEYDVWPPTFAVRDPDGDTVAPDVISDGVYRMLIVPNPVPGDWTVEWTQSSWTGEAPNTLVAAHVANPRPRCRAGFSSFVSRVGDRIALRATPEYAGYRVLYGATLSARIRRPDQSHVEVPLTYDPLLGEYSAVFPTDELRGRGNYEAIVRCQVLDGASTHPGESFGDRHHPRTGPAAVAFRRETTARFFYDTAELPPLPGIDTPFAGDCDGDGIGNEVEPAGDTDDDGVPDVCDGDADGDDVPDTIDPDPTTPQGGCAVAPSNIGCCSSVMACHGGGFALYADGHLALADGTEVLEANGTPAMVANAGELDTNIGTNNVLGTLYSVAPVTLRTATLISGSVWTEGSITKQTDVTVTGLEWSESELTLPKLTAFNYEFAAGPFSPVSLEPNVSIALAPGFYGAVSVKSGATLRLTSGLYEVDSLIVEPEGHLDVSLTNGPLYFYSRGTIIVRGMLAPDADAHDMLFASLGTADVTLEAPFKGTVVAPSAKTMLTGAPHQGAIFSRYIQVNPDAIIEHRRFSHDWLFDELGPCGNGVLDGLETDIDCGGASCRSCATGQGCSDGSDCTSGACENGTCASLASLTAELTMTSSSIWSFCANVDLHNTGVAPTSDWEVTLGIQQSTLNAWWGGSFGQDETVVSVTGLDWNRVIAPGSGTSFGFCGIPSEANFTPTLLGAVAN